MKSLQIIVILLFAALSLPLLTYAQVAPAPDRGPNEGEGPFERLIIRGATVIDGTGSPPRSPMDIVIEGNRIVRVTSVGAPHVDINENRRPGEATFEIDAHGNT